MIKDWNVLNIRGLQIRSLSETLSYNIKISCFAYNNIDKIVTQFHPVRVTDCPTYILYDNSNW